MLVAVKTPHIEITMRGKIPQNYIDLLKNDFGGNVSIEDEGDDFPEDIFTSPWYTKKSMENTPGATLKFYRKLHHLTQKELAHKLSMQSQTVSNMETGIRPISRFTAHKLANIFDIPAGRFI